MSESFLNDRITLHCGDCLDVLATLPENSIDRRRMELCLSGSDERQRESIKMKLKNKPLDHGPLFGRIA